MPEISIKKKEAKTVTLTIKDNDGVVVDVSSAILTFEIKKSPEDAAFLVQKDDADFNKTDALNGVVNFILTTADTDRSGVFVGELKIQFGATDIAKSEDISVRINKAITD